MSRTINWILIVVMAGIVGCSAGSDENVTGGEQPVCKDYPEDSWRARYLELGSETYETACASCHDEGQDGAPTRGDRDSWANRSPLWEAVLLEHAKNGYLNMPPRGGQAGLSDRAVEAAGEFMLSETFPEMQRD